MIQKIFLSFLAALAMSTTAWAFSPLDFEAEKFRTDQKSGKAVVIDVYANWCPTCKAQQKDLEAIFKDDRFKDITVYKVDFDDTKLRNQISSMIGRPISRQSTLIFFKGDEILGFSVAERGDKLKAHLEKLL